MKTNCTELFLRYREICRMIWNLGFFPQHDTRQYGCAVVYDEAIARLFEAMILRSLGISKRIVDNFARPGATTKFSVHVKDTGGSIIIDRNFPSDSSHMWDAPPVRLDPSTANLRFLNFFNWDQIGVLDSRLIQVLIERFNDQPKFEGRLGLIAVEDCTIWLDDDERDAIAEIEPEIGIEKL